MYACGDVFPKSPARVFPQTPLQLVGSLSAFEKEFPFIFPHNPKNTARHECGLLM
jgi:hypothetical protein